MLRIWDVISTCAHHLDEIRCILDVSTLETSLQLIAAGEVNFIPTRHRVRLRNFNILGAILVLLHSGVVHICEIDEWIQETPEGGRL